MATKEFPLALVIKAVDKATGPLSKINDKLRAFNAPFEKLGKQVKDFGQLSGLTKFGSALGGVGSATKKVGSELLGTVGKMAALAAGAGGAFLAIAKGALDAGDDLATHAQRVGLTVDAYAQLRYAAAQNDVEADQFASSLDMLNKGLGDMTLNRGKLYKELSKASPEFLKQVKGAKNTTEAIDLLSKAFVKIQDPQRRASLAAAAFGSENVQMGQFLGTGGEAIDKLKNHYLALAGSQEKFANGGSDLDNATKDTIVAFEGLRNAAFAELFPALTKLATALSGLLAGNRGKIADWAKKAGDAITAWVSSGGVERLVDGLGKLADVGGRVLGFMERWPKLSIALMNPGLTGSVLSLGGSLLKLGWALKGPVSAGFTLLGPILSGTVIPALGAMWASMTAGLAVLGPILLPIIAVATALGSVGLAIYEVIKHWKELKEVFTDGNGWKAWSEMVTKPLAALKTAKEFYFGKSKSDGAPAPVASAAAGATGTAAVAPTAAPVQPPPGAGPTAKTEVAVKFENMPKGARVTKSGKAPTKVETGYANGGPG